MVFSDVFVVNFLDFTCPTSLDWFFTLVLVLLREMLLCYILYIYFIYVLLVPDTTFECDFLNVFGYLVCSSVSFLIVSGLYFSLLNFLNLFWCTRHFVFISLVLIVSSIIKRSSLSVIRSPSVFFCYMFALCNSFSPVRSNVFISVCIWFQFPIPCVYLPVVLMYLSFRK